MPGAPPAPAGRPPGTATPLVARVDAASRCARGDRLKPPGRTRWLTSLRRTRRYSTTSGRRRATGVRPDHPITSWSGVAEADVPRRQRFPNRLRRRGCTWCPGWCLFAGWGVRTLDRRGGCARCPACPRPTRGRRALRVACGDLTLVGRARCPGRTARADPAESRPTSHEEQAPPGPPPSTSWAAGPTGPARVNTPSSPDPTTRGVPAR
jgi:hypothetical protein